ncbi:MAG TPA: triose-phosphate isomerase [Promineifilum sp.]|nr:triose-phosphate isomerase [Promineifilum sp.]HRO90593.1 triose-phosphate isomerase [Promineifilum sp.]HRQ12820.1 triose-phosphate isomerase [Promineifilum sp.]
MRTPFVAGNWKMNKTPDAAAAFVREIAPGLNAIDGIDIAVCPPFLAIPAVAQVLAGTKIGVGAQNMYYEVSGAYTGEISPAMLQGLCRYVILGHSERRALFGETDEGVNKKIKAALAHNLTPIVCVGESLAQNEAGETQSFVSGQVRAAFAGLDSWQAAVCVVAYEPIWAIGTGRSATAQQAGDIIRTSVRDVLADMFGNDTAQAIRIQYGGSVTETNIADYMAQPDIDGALVGGASLKTSFIDLVRAAVI